MDYVSVAELIQLLQNESASIDMQYQLWITITSAVAIGSLSICPRFVPLSVLGG